jgi:MarR family transcriptional regulator for hemolysin
LRIAQIRVFQRYYKGPHMQGYDISTGAYATLLAIRQNPGIGRNQLADALLTQRPNMTALLNSLERAGYIRREADQLDRRATKIFLTRTGRLKIDSMIPNAIEHDRATTAALTASERRSLLGLLRKLSDSLS